MALGAHAQAMALQGLLAHVVRRQGNLAARSCWGAWRRLSREGRRMQGLLAHVVRCQKRRAAEVCWGAWGLLSREAQRRRKQQERVIEHHRKAARKTSMKEQEDAWRCWRWVVEGGRKRRASQQHYFVQSSRWHNYHIALRYWLLWSVPVRSRHKVRSQAFAGPHPPVFGKPPDEERQAAGQSVWASGTTRHLCGALGPILAREGQVPQRVRAPRAGPRAALEELEELEEALTQDCLLAAEKSPRALSRAASSPGSTWALSRAASSPGSIFPSSVFEEQPAPSRTPAAGAGEAGRSPLCAALQESHPPAPAPGQGGRATPGRPALTVVWPALALHGGGSSAHSPWEFGRRAAAVVRRGDGSPA